MTILDDRKKPCRDCDLLWLGHTAKPHDYLVAMEPTKPAGTTKYQCLICDSKPIHETDGTTSLWK